MNTYIRLKDEYNIEETPYAKNALDHYCQNVDMEQCGENTIFILPEVNGKREIRFLFYSFPDLSDEKLKTYQSRIKVCYVLGQIAAAAFIAVIACCILKVMPNANIAFSVTAATNAAFGLGWAFSLLKWTQLKGKADEQGHLQILKVSCTKCQPVFPLDLFPWSEPPANEHLNAHLFKEANTDGEFVEERPEHFEKPKDFQNLLIEPARVFRVRKDNNETYHHIFTAQELNTPWKAIFEARVPEAIKAEQYRVAAFIIAGIAAGLLVGSICVAATWQFKMPRFGLATGLFVGAAIGGYTANYFMKKRSEAHIKGDASAWLAWRTIKQLQEIEQEIAKGISIDAQYIEFRKDFIRQLILFTSECRHSCEERMNAKYNSLQSLDDKKRFIAHLWAHSYLIKRMQSNEQNFPEMRYIANRTMNGCALDFE